ncbi:MAG: nucleotidyltransferase domain-containing protein [Kangiellaceae bacterium]|jgi:predicted nucleotidyltransferase|nr:nucleotidyltransferase domain-containing protein [Kangiellaceae bacterium]
MELEEIKADLRVIERNLKPKIKLVDCLIFGSILINSKRANDIDILIIYDNHEQIPVLKEEFKSLEKIYPLHLNYFTFEEERELDFITEQSAEYIFKLR